MSYLATLKDLGLTEAAPPKTFEGFEGARPRGFLPEEAAKPLIFSSEKKKKRFNQFYMDLQNPQKGRAEGDPCRETRLPQAPSKPPKGSEDEPEAWRRRFYILNSTEAPCPGFRLSMDWRQTYDAAHAFLELHAEQAHALGWGTLDLFAVHRTVGGTRVDCCGVVMLMAGSEVLSITPGAIALRRSHDSQPCGRFFRTPHKPEMVPVWSFKQ